MTRNRWHSIIHPARAWMLPGLIALLVAAGSRDSSSYFLHFDTPELHVAAINVIHACGAAATGKPGIVLLLLPFFALGGFNPHWDTLLQTLLAALTIVALYRLLARLTGSRRRAMLGALWFLSLPIILYYTRMHLGYALAFFTLGLMLQAEGRYGWAGLAFGQALTSHLTLLVPLAAWLGFSALVAQLERQPGRVRNFLKLGVSILPPILLIEAYTFFINGIPFGWLRSVIGVGGRVGADPGGTTWTHLWEVVRLPNGWLNAALLLAGVLYPLVRKPRVPLMDAVYLAGWSVVGVYTLRTGLTHTVFLSRLLVGVYPLLAMASTFTLTRLAARIGRRLAPPLRGAYRLALGAVVVVGLPLALVGHTLDAAVGSRTAYHVADAVVAQAGEAGLPVRYAGNQHAAKFAGLRHHVEMSINEDAVDVITGDSRAVLIFEDTNDPILAALLADPRFDPSRYTVSTYAHLRPYRPAQAERFFLSTAQAVALRKRPHARQPGAEPTRMQVWWPNDPQGTFVARRDVDFEAASYVIHYDGGPCTASRRFGGDTQFYYQVLLERGREVGAALREGDLGGAWDIFWTALTS